MLAAGVRPAVFAMKRLREQSPVSLPVNGGLRHYLNEEDELNDDEDHEEKDVEQKATPVAATAWVSESFLINCTVAECCSYLRGERGGHPPLNPLQILDLILDLSSAPGRANYPLPNPLNPIPTPPHCTPPIYYRREP